MSITWLPREQGMVVRCNGAGCTTKFHTAIIVAGNVRDWLKKQEGWGRGSRTGTKKVLGTKRHDLCPPCLKLDKELAAQDAKEKAERKEARDAARKAKFSGAPLPKKKRTRKAATVDVSTVSASPSAASDQAAPTP